MMSKKSYVNLKRSSEKKQKSVVFVSTIKEIQTKILNNLNYKNVKFLSVILFRNFDKFLEKQF